MKRMNYLAVMLTTALLSLAQPVLGLDVRLGDSAGNTPAAATSGPPLMASLQLLTEKPGQGEPVLFELLLRLQPGVAIGAGTTLTSLGEWEVVRVAPGPLLNDRNGQAVRKDQLTLRTFASGKVDVPAWIQPYRGADGQAGEFRTAPLTVTVEPVPGQPGDRPGEIRKAEGCYVAGMPFQKLEGLKLYIVFAADMSGSGELVRALALGAGSRAGAAGAGRSVVVEQAGTGRNRRRGGCSRPAGG
jgi:hypothetical protein